MASKEILGTSTKPMWIRAIERLVEKISPLEIHISIPLSDLQQPLESFSIRLRKTNTTQTSKDKSK
ncbi:MAG: hypothetical protein UV80_C0014G0012 [Candidatus Peregrinibacteria bacterium GW2011_GWF2_43_17]|nr:MAG: hypothetical protein UV80_C0014G0012 [Candidatus Peregrinibacteria bacterium GW2011_GWF2_43_17]KKT18586.1 MAG: hypothetical protein UW03_C0037G0007 [Candidatus Peregrinibacteria bacterium GW2011_GWA2_43_8]HAU39362.1 hypothetical protein [Candidatus Peregrinibacteria bacterium]